MSEGAGGWLWLVVDVGLVAALGIVLACGTLQYRKDEGRGSGAEGSTGLIENGVYDLLISAMSVCTFLVCPSRLTVISTVLPTPMSSISSVKSDRRRTGLPFNPTITSPTVPA